MKRRYEDTQREKEEKDHNSKATEEPVSDPIDVDDNGNEEDFVDYESEKRRKKPDDVILSAQKDSEGYCSDQCQIW